MIKTNDDYLDSNKFRKILEKYEESVKSGQPEFLDAEDLTDIAQYYSLVENWDKARETVDYAIRLHPGAVSSLVFKSRMTLLKDNNPEEAERIADLAEDKNDLDYYYIKAEILLAQHKTKEADDYLLDCLKNIGPDDYEDFLFDVANMYEDYEQFDKTEEWLLRSKTKTDSIEYKELMACALLQSGNFEGSKAIFNELIDKNPYSAKYWKSLALAQQLNGEISDSISSIEYAIAIDPSDNDAVRSKADGLFKLDNYEEAINYYQRCANNCPLDESGEMMIGICYYNMQKSEEAILHLKKAEDIAEPESENLVQIYQELALSLNERKQYNEALSYIDKTDDLDCDHIDMKVLKGHILLAERKLDDAMDIFREAFSDSKSSPEVLLQIGVSIFENKYIEKAYEIFGILFKICDLDWSVGYSHMAVCCKKLGKEAEFINFVRVASERNPLEAKEILGYLFPSGMDPGDYYQYLYNKLNNK